MANSRVNKFWRLDTASATNIVDSPVYIKGIYFYPNANSDTFTLLDGQGNRILLGTASNAIAGLFVPYYYPIEETVQGIRLSALSASAEIIIITH